MQSNFSSARPWEQYAYNVNNPTTLYLYENDPDWISLATWTPASRDVDGKIDLEGYSTGGGTKQYTANNILHIQSSYKGLQSIDIERPVMTNDELGIETVNVYDHDHASSAISTLDRSLAYVNDKRSYLGAMQNRLEHAMNVDDNSSENTQAAESRLRDTDMADEMVEYSKHNILSQMGQSMLSQANQQTSQVLALLQ